MDNVNVFHSSYQCRICFSKRAASNQLFYFPKTLARTSQWLDNCHLGSQFCPQEAAGKLLICGQHFEEKHFTTSEKKRLNRTALPTLILQPDAVEASQEELRNFTEVEASSIKSIDNVTRLRIERKAVKRLRSMYRLKSKKLKEIASGSLSHMIDQMDTFSDNQKSNCKSDNQKRFKTFKMFQ